MIIIALKMLFFDKPKKTGDETRLQQNMEGSSTQASIQVNTGNDG
jgi:hypothetical protein